MKRGDLGKRVKETSNGSGDFLDIKEAGDAVVHFHANADVGEDAEIEERFVAWVPAEPEDRKKQTGNRGYKRRFSFCDSDKRVPWRDLLEALERADGMDEDETVLRAGGAEYTKGEILGRGDWSKDLRAKPEFLFAVVASSEGGERIKEPKLRILAAKPSLAEAIDAVAAAQVREHGEEEGEPAVAGYGIELIYDAEAKARNMYRAAYNGRKASGKVAELLDGPGLDLRKHCRLSKADAQEMEELIAAALVVRVPGLDIEPEGQRERRGASRRAEEREPAREAGGRRPLAERARAGRREEPEEDEEADRKPAGRNRREDPEPEPERPSRRPAARREEPEEEPEEKPKPAARSREPEPAREPEPEASEKPKRRRRAETEPEKVPEEPAAAGKGAESAAAPDSAEVQCPKCKATVKVSQSQKSCTACNHRIIPW
jgi:hypothetical protein